MVAAEPDWSSRPDSFGRLVADLAPDEAIFRARLASAQPAARRYVLLFTPRSGSSWLAFVLAQTGLFGQPFEYIYPEHVVGYARAAGTTDPAGLLAVLLRQQQTANGVFGTKVRAVDILLFGEAPFFAEFGADTAWFYLSRENIVAQAVSLYRAEASGRWHSYNSARPPPDYHAAAIGECVERLAATEHNNELLLRRRGVRARRLRYESLVPDRHTAIAIFSAALGVVIPPIAVSIMPTLRAVRDDWNDTAEERFRRENRELIEGIENRRMHIES